MSKAYVNDSVRSMTHDQHELEQEDNLEVIASIILQAIKRMKAMNAIQE
ncbi:hypothetical protein MKZ15_23820 [Paenibacillus sp. FSL R7-0216]